MHGGIMDVMEAIEKRKSNRGFLKKPVSKRDDS